MKTYIKYIVRKNRVLNMLFDIYKYITGKASIISVTPVYFEGWKMATGTHTPWMNGGANALANKFTIVDFNLKKLVAENKILLTQFNPQNVLPELDDLTWRHYVVYWSSQFAIDNTKTKIKKFAEFGVCDGLTIFYAISALRESPDQFEVYLYDAWEAMKKELLLDSEMMSAGSYSYLNIDNTKNNLTYLGLDNLIFNKGYIPEVFDSSTNPDQLVWMHIDLNSAIPTVSALNRFWDTLEIGGLVLVDDYAYPGYEDTQSEVEAWACDKECILMHLPTGQAIIFKLSGSE